MAKSLINIPSFLRGSLEGNRAITLTGTDISSTNSESTSSFMYDVADMPLKSTQQLSVDWSKFEEHTFFTPATINVNSAFDKIINGFPFDGTRVELERFLENLTGYEYWVLQQFPKYRGQLHLHSASNQYIEIKDSAGSLFPSLARPENDGLGVISPRAGESLTVEFNFYPPEQESDTCIIFQQMSNPGTPSQVGYVLTSVLDASKTAGDLLFTVTSGAYGLTTNTGLTLPKTTKGEFNHIVAEFDNSNLGQTLRLTVDGVRYGSYTTTGIGTLHTPGTSLMIGSGSAYSATTTGLVTPNTTLSGVLDEFRVYRSIRTQAELDNYTSRSVYSQDDLVLYLKFNEPSGTLVPGNSALDALVLDSSGNSLHSTVQNFTANARVNASGSVYGDPMSLEKELYCPILFPGQTDVVTLNTQLLASASLYDSENPNVITKLVPKHYFLEGQVEEGLSTEDGTIVDMYTGTLIPGSGKLGSAQLMMSLLYTYARFFDELKMYVDAFSTTQYVGYDRVGSTPDTFLHRYLVQHGFATPPIFSNSTIEQYVDAENIEYSTSTSAVSLKYVQNELLRRVLTNLPSIVRSKGTQYSIRALLRSFGIDPDNSCRIREYGGPSRSALGLARESKRQIGYMTSFETNTLYLTPCLSASRLEVGYPEPIGTMIDKGTYPPHGISNAVADNILTSGSWTVETLVRFPVDRTGSLTGYDSIARMWVSGSTSPMQKGLVANFLAHSGSPGSLVLYARPGATTTSDVLQLVLSDVDVYDGDIWHVAFGRRRADDGGMSNVSSSYFIRASKASSGDIAHNYFTSSLLYASPDMFSSLYVAAPGINQFGPYLAVGQNQVFNTGALVTHLLLNNTTASPTAARYLDFTGQLASMRLWSKYMTDGEWQEHTLNPASAGVIDPLVNYNFTHAPTGAFGRLRLEAFAKQPITCSNALGEITALDFTGNNLHMSGTGYTAGGRVMVPVLFEVSHISPLYDEPTTNEKVRIRGFQDQTNIDLNPGSSVAPVFDIEPSEQPQDDTRLSIEFSLVEALNRDIITIFSTLEAIDNAVGDPALQFSPDYPDLDRLRDIYFNRLTGKLNFKAFHEFFKFFDVSLSTMVEQLVPKKTKFKGVNFLVESHMLERHKLEYFSSEIYLGEYDRFDLNHSLLLQQIVGSVRRY